MMNARLIAANRTSVEVGNNRIQTKIDASAQQLHHQVPACYLSIVGGNWGDTRSSFPEHRSLHQLPSRWHLLIARSLPSTRFHTRLPVMWCHRHEFWLFMPLTCLVQRMSNTTPRCLAHCRCTLQHSMLEDKDRYHASSLHTYPVSAPPPGNILLNNQQECSKLRNTLS